MDKRERANTRDSSFLSPEDAVAGLDPLLQPFRDSDGVPVYSIRPSSIFYIPAPSIHGEDVGHPSPQHRSSSISKCFAYCERFSGILYSLLASLLFTTSNFIIKQFNVVLLDVFLVRFVFQGLISLGYIIHQGDHPFSHSNKLLLFIRSLIAAAGSVCFYLGLSLLPLPDLTTLKYTQVIWTALLALLVFRERITLPTIIASVLTLVGVVCVAQPSFLFPQMKSVNATDQVTFPSTNNPRLVGMLFALTCAFSMSTGIVLNKKLLQKNVRQSIIMFHFIITTFLLLLILQTYYWTSSKANRQRFDIRTIYLTRNFIFATILATLQLVPMVLSQKSVKREHPSIVTVVQASDILFAIIFQNLFSPTKSNGLALVGSMLVLASIVIVGAHKLWQDRLNRTCLPTTAEDER